VLSPPKQGSLYATETKEAWQIEREKLAGNSMNLFRIKRKWDTSVEECPSKDAGSRSGSLEMHTFL
jgi:hypothetical protein